MSKKIEKRLLEFRSRSYALVKMQSSLENESIVEIIEKAIENYVNEDIKKVVNAQYGDWEERPKKSGRPKSKKIENKQDEEVVKDKINDDNFKQDEEVTEEDKELLDLYK